MSFEAVRDPASIESAAAATTNPFMGKALEQQVTVHATGAWQVTIHGHHAELETVWRRLEAEGHCTVFQTYDWAACWYDAAVSCGEAEPVIVAISKEGTGLVWILPLCLYRKKRLRIISFADLGVTDYTAPVMARGAPSDQSTIQAMIKAVFEALPPCDIINFQKLSDKVEGIPNPLLFLRSLERFPADCHGIRLHEPWPELADKIMQSRLRSTIRRQKKNIQKEGEVAIEHHHSSETLGPVMDRLMAIRRARLNAIGRPDTPPVWRNFYHALATRRNRTLNVSITTMTVSGEAVATCFGLTRGKTYYAILPTFGMGRWESFRPGMLLLDAMLTAFAEQAQEEGYFDFTVGDEVYKKRFGSESHPLYEWMAPRSAAGLAVYTAWRAKVALRRHSRLFAMLKKL